MIAPLPPQFRQTARSFASEAIALGSETVLEMFISATVEHKQVRHKRRGIDVSKPTLSLGCDEWSEGEQFSLPDLHLTLNLAGSNLEWVGEGLERGEEKSRRAEAPVAG